MPPFFDSRRGQIDESREKTMQRDKTPTKPMLPIESLFLVTTIVFAIMSIAFYPDPRPTLVTHWARRHRMGALSH